MLLLIGFGFALTESKSILPDANWKNQSVSEYLVNQGWQAPEHYRTDLDSSKIRQGEDLVNIGYTRIDRINTKKISKHFVCINCHNVVPETKSPNISNPEERLTYMMENKLPFLQGSSLYGVINREAYFNGDYEKKFGNRALEARKDLGKAIQLCAEISSEGRVLEDWEVESILHYLNSIGLKMSDLFFNDDQVEVLHSNDKNQRIELVKSKYVKKYAATFGFPLAANIRSKGKKGDWQKGEYIFKFGCMHCHNPEGITTFTLEADQLNRSYLKNRMDKTNKKSIYEITRTGTQPKKLKKTYMPPYTYEKLTDEQLEHLAAYLNYKQ